MRSRSFETFRGTLSDGRTAAALNVTVHLEENALDIRKIEAEPGEQWLYEELTSASPLAPGRSTQLGTRARKGARLFVADTGFAEEILARAPHMSSVAEQRRVLAPMLAVAAVIAGLIAVIWYLEYSPARAIASLLPEKARSRLGDLVVESMTSNKKVCAAPEGQAALDKVLGRLKNALGAGHRFQLRVVDLGIVNAFATPGERIIVSAGLIKFTQSPEELAGVIAHEIGHGLERHPETGIVRALGISAGLELLLGGSAGSLGEIGAVLLQLRYTRKAETEADRHAIVMLRTAEIPVRAFAEFFKRMQARTSWKGGKNAKKSGPVSARRVLQLLRTHPATAERIAMISSMNDGPTRSLLTGSEWSALRAICSAT